MHRAILREAIPSGLLLLLIIDPAAAQRVPDVRVDRAPACCGALPLGLVAEGDTLYALLGHTGTTTGAHLNRSEDRGVTWLATDVLVPGPGGQVLSAQLAASGRTVLVLWSEANGGSGRRLLVNRSLDGGDTWLSNPVVVTDSGTPAEEQIEIRGQNVHVAWSDTAAPTAGTRVASSYDAGSTWETPTRISGSLVNTATPQLAVAASRLHALFVQNPEPFVHRIWLSTSPDNGATWSGARPGPRFWDILGAPRLAVSGNTLHLGVEGVLARPIEGYGAYHDRTSDDGETWFPGGPTRIDTSPIPNYNPFAPSLRLAVRGPEVYTVWTDRRNSLTEQDLFFNRSLDAGQTWLSTDLQINTSGFTYEPALALADGLVVVAWADITTPPREIYVNRSVDQGNTWLAAERRLATSRPAGGGTVGITNWPTFLATSGAAAYVMWLEARPGTSHAHTYFNIPFGLRRYGTGTPGSGGLLPDLDGRGRALIGESFRLEISDGYGGAAGAFIIGASAGSTPLFGGTLLVGVSAEAIATALGGTPGVPGDGSLSLQLPIPSSTAFVGLPLFFQLLTVDPGAIGSVSMSNGLELWIG